MASLGSLVVSLAADTARFQGDLGRAAQLAESRMRSIKDTTQQAMTAVTIATTAAATSLAYALKGAIDRADDMRDMAQAAGVTVEQLSRLEYAGKTSGVGIEVVGKALAKLAKGGAPDANAALIDLARQFALMPDGAAKTAKAIDIFGERIGPQLIPLLNQGADGLAELAAQADRVGYTLSTEAANGADEFNDKIALLSATSSGLINTLAAELLPVLNDVADALVTAAADSERSARMADQVSTFFKVLTTTATFLYVALDKIANRMAAVAAASAAMVKDGPMAALRVLKEANAAEAEAQRSANEFLERLWSEREKSAQKAADRLDAILSAPGGRNRKGSGLTFVPDAAPSGRTGRSGSGGPALLPPLEDYRSTLAGILDGFEADTQTTQEATLQSWTEFMAKLDALFAAGRIDAETYNARMLEKNAEILEPITITAEKIFPPAEQEKFSEFWVQASRNTQDILANWLYDPFEEGIQGMLKAFGDMLLQMAAQALAADITSKIFGSNMGGGGGLLGSFMSMLGGLGGGGGSGLSEIAITAQKIPGYAKGGYIPPGSLGWTGENGPEMIYGGKSGVTVTPVQAGGGINVTQHFVLEAPNGSVSRQTQQQIAAAAARGLAAASRRN